MKHISILGSTGSIGKNSLQVAELNPDRYKVVYLTAGSNVELLAEQAKKFKPEAVAINDESKYSELKNRLAGESIDILAGASGILELAGRQNVEIVLNAIVGAPGLKPTIKAIENGRDVALSNKESLVMAGELIMNMLVEKNVHLYPVDSEHSAIWQCLTGEKMNEVNKIILTGSGGPFRTAEKSEMVNVKPEQALKHPTWSMGRKITIDSATMMNKCLEIIEARWLFNLPPEKIEVLIHPQSVIHSMVEFQDGSIKAQLGMPDMKLPIQYALSYPDRLNIKWENTDFASVGQLTFEAPDFEKFPSLRLAYDVLRIGGTAPAILNVVNEQAVYLFLENQIKFTDIPHYVEKALENIDIVQHPKLDDILEAEQKARLFVKEMSI